MRLLILLLALANSYYLYLQVEDRRQAPAAAPAPPPVADDITTMLLLAEVPRSELRERGAAGDAAADGAVRSAGEAGASAGSAGQGEAASGPICVTLGPLDEPEQVAAVADWLRERGIETRARAGQHREVVHYWVYLQPLESTQAARERLAALQSRGLTDLQVIARGNMADAISLGVYSREESMRRRVEALRALGEAPEVSERTRTEREQWLDLPPGIDLEAERDALAERFPDLSPGRVRCEDPA